MKRWVSVFLTMMLVFAFTGTSLAALPPDALALSIDPIKESYKVGERVKLTVYARVGGTFQETKLQVVPIEGGSTEDQLKDVKTEKHKRQGDLFITTGSFTPSKSGVYQVTATATMRSDYYGGKIITEVVTETFSVTDPKEVILSVTPSLSRIQLGQEVPILITYNGDYSPKLTVSEEFTELYMKRVNNIRQKLVLFKPEKAGTYVFKIVVETKYDRAVEEVKVEVIE
ncbi:MAG TPA: hypothetical protein VE710_03310 [Candidatus Bathyarchaeia archaeon]|nr:hypothetical protein [Candidatus Bathyarchaeia archaeon]